MRELHDFLAEATDPVAWLYLTLATMDVLALLCLLQVMGVPM